MGDLPQTQDQDLEIHDTPLLPPAGVIGVDRALINNFLLL
jgi:hypothetical protein